MHCRSPHSPYQWLLLLLLLTQAGSAPKCFGIALGACLMIASNQRACDPAFCAQLASSVLSAYMAQSSLHVLRLGRQPLCREGQIPLPTALTQGTFLTSLTRSTYEAVLNRVWGSCRERVDALAAAYKQKKSEGTEAGSSSRATAPASSPQAGHALDKPQCSWQRQAQLLLKRSWRQISRDRATIVARTVANVSAALIFGSIFNRMKLSETAIQDRLGLLQVMLPQTNQHFVSCLNSGPYLHSRHPLKMQ